MTDSRDNNVGIAFGAVLAAGASTAVGAAIVFFPRLVKLASRRVLASSLGISAGVMTYVSFVEIFQKAVGAFYDMNEFEIEDEDKRLGKANLYATLSFFAGVFVMVAIDLIVKGMTKRSQSKDPEINSAPHDGDACADHHDIGDTLQKVENGDPPGPVPPASAQTEEVVVSCGCSRADPAGDLEEWQRKATEEEERDRARADGGTLYTGISKNDEGVSVSSKESQSPPHLKSENVNVVDVDIVQKEFDEVEENKKLVRMGMQTALAIALHNFPEGLATYVAVLDDPSIGAVLAIAIGIHNIPEGFCVALPIYYATGDRKKAFMWGALSGMSEPIGALLGYIVLANAVSEAIYGIMFGLVGGMMVMISLKELLPTAYRYDPADTVVTNSLIFGMLVISASLVLFYL